MSHLLERMHRLDRRLVSPLDPELEAYEAQGYRYELHRGVAVRRPTIFRAGPGSFTSPIPTDLIYANTASGTAKNTFTTEAVINDTAGMGPQPILGTYYWLPQIGTAKTLRLVARGIFSDVATAPTWQWFCRFGSTEASTAGPNVGSSAALTSVVITNAGWEFELDVTMRTMGAAGANSTVIGMGQITSFTGLASPFGGTLFGAGASPGTVSIDTSITNHINFSAACGTSNASNSIQLLQLLVMGLN